MENEDDDESYESLIDSQDKSWHSQSDQALSSHTQSNR